MKKRIHKLLGIGISAGLVFGLIGALFATPVSADLMEWGIVNTPSWEDDVIVPGSDILDYDIGGDGDIIYAILELGCDRDTDWCDNGEHLYDYGLFKSEDGGVTWSDITEAVYTAASLPDCTTNDFDRLWFVAVAPDDEDWVAVVGMSDVGSDDGEIWVVASKDGGDNFTFAGEVADGTADTDDLDFVFDLHVSIEVDGIHNIAVAGREDDTGYGTIFRLKAGTWLSGSWEDTSGYLGWDTTLEAIIACAFSPNFDIDDTIVCLGTDYWEGLVRWGSKPVLQSGIWESSDGAWNDDAGFPSSMEITADGDTLITSAYNRTMGLALPADYDGSDPGARSFYIYVNAMNWTTGLVGGFLMRVDNGSVSEPYGPSGEPLLASIDFHGDADTGKMIIGEYYKWDNDINEPISVFPDGEDPTCCAGVRVWHTTELDPCCPNWELACKDPSGPYFALVMYTPDGDKAYATTSGTLSMDQDDDTYDDLIYNLASDMGLTVDLDDWVYDDGTPGDESAFSVSRDDGVSFNQLGLIDTDIDKLGDVAVCPDCGVIYLSTYQYDDGGPCDYQYCGGYEDYSVCCDGDWYCNCSSVWRSYNNGDTWERVFHGDWYVESSDDLLLRLPCDELEGCCDQDPVAPSGTIYLGIAWSNRLFYSRDCGQCWNETPATKIVMEDFAVESENIVYIISDDAEVSKSTQYGRRWSDPVDTGMDDAETIVACCAQGLVVAGGENGEVAYSEDGGESWELTDDLPDDDDVTVACDPICEGTIYAALESGDFGGIFRWVVGESTAWDDLGAIKTDYHGIGVGRSDGTLYALSDQLYVDTSKDLCDEDRFVEECNGEPIYEFSGVARNLTPCETACCGTEDWDYLVCGLTTPRDWYECDNCDLAEDFDKEANGLKLCGCISIGTNTVLYAIDNRGNYYVEDGSDGSLWSYEDCAAKLGPTLTSPADGAVLDCEPCAGCDAANFTLKWERMCEACSYDIQIMDEDGNIVVEWVDVDITGDPPSLYVDEALECGLNYTWHVREANTSCECVHSPWSETWTFTVAVGAADAIQLLAPTKGAMDVPINNIGFSWTSVRNASSYSFVLSPNANLTGALVSQDMSTTAFNYVGPLDYSKAYYWQIIAWQDGTRLTTSSIGVFNTMAEPVAPTPPVVVEQQPAPVINIPPAEKITPTWIYAIIGIGCALAVVVIVLIVRTRRP